MHLSHHYRTWRNTSHTADSEQWVCIIKHKWGVSALYKGTSAKNIQLVHGIEPPTLWSQANSPAFEALVFPTAFSLAHILRDWIVHMQWFRTSFLLLTIWNPKKPANENKDEDENKDFYRSNLFSGEVFKYWHPWTTRALNHSGKKCVLVPHKTLNYYSVGNWSKNISIQGEDSAVSSEHESPVPPLLQNQHKKMTTVTKIIYFGGLFSGLIWQ